MRVVTGAAATVLFGLWVGVAVLIGQADGVATGLPPTLSPELRAKIQLAAVQVENAQLRMALAQRDYDSARERLAASVAAASVSGYDLDIATLTYHKRPLEPSNK